MSLLNYNKNKECSCVGNATRNKDNSPRTQWQNYCNEFIERFLPQCTSARGSKNLAALVFSAAEFFINIYSDVRTKQSVNVKHSQRKKKVSGIEKI